MTFGEQNTEKEAHDILNYAFENGINALDTAEAVSSSNLNLHFLYSISFYTCITTLDEIQVFGLVYYI